MDMSPGERCRHIRERLTEDGVYNQWLVSSEPFWIEEKQFSFLESLGSHLHSFYKASNRLFYEYSWQTTGMDCRVSESW